MWGRGQRGNSAACSALAPLSVMSLTSHSGLCPLGTDSQGGGLVYVLGLCESLQQTLLWDWESLLPLQFPQVFAARGFEALFPCARSLGCLVHLTPQLFLLAYLCIHVGHPGLPSAPHLRLTCASPALVCHQLLPCRESSPTWLPISSPSTSLDECFFFNSLVFGLPWSLIFWQFWLVFVFKLVVILLLFVWGSEACLPMPPSLIYPQLSN